LPELPPIESSYVIGKVWAIAEGAEAPKVSLKDCTVLAKHIEKLALQYAAPNEQPKSSKERDQQSKAIVKPSPINFAQLATRKQLIGAYGSFTGMDMSWFKNLKDTPKLLEARKADGKGGRNHAEPFFCPFEVMLWLIDGKRRKGRAMKSDTGWRMLKQHFPEVYEAHRVGSPIED
jgi:hypothetical protein